MSGISLSKQLIPWTQVRETSDVKCEFFFAPLRLCETYIDALENADGHDHHDLS